jgi:hypothetical protein
LEHRDASDLPGSAGAAGPHLRSGKATATFTPNSSDDADIGVTIFFADGAREIVDMHVANPSSAHSWRLEIGSATGPSGPPPATRASP